MEQDEQVSRMDEDSGGKRKTRDKFDIADLIVSWIAKLLIPIVLAAGAWMIKGEIDNTSRDVDLMARFQEIYYNEDTRRFALHFIRRVNDPITQRQLREFIVWDRLENATAKINMLTFNKEDSDWHLLGDVVLDLNNSFC